jgi:hypothetical protein
MDDMGKQFGVGDKTNLDIDTIIKDAAKGQLSLSRLQNEGLVRATARQILIEDIKAGKIKDISISEAINMKEPIDPFRKIYGEDALERLDSLAPDFNRLTSEQEAAKLARSKFTIEPKEVPVDESMTYDELGNLIKKGPDEPETKADGGIIGRRGMFLGGFLSKLINSNPEIVSALKTQQTPSDVPLTLQERYRKYLSEAETTPTNNDSAIGGLLGRFLKGSGIVTPQGGSTSANDFLYNLYRKNLETKADGGRIGYAKGKKVVSSIDKLLEQLNTKLSKKTSMESVNPKTGEVTIPKKPLRKAEEPTGVTVMDNEPDTIDEKAFSKTKSRQLTKEEIEDYEAELGDSETWLSEGTVEEAEKALKKRKDEYAYYYQQYKMGKLDPVAGDKSESRMKFLRKKAQEAEMTGDRRLITSDEMDELSDLESTYLNDVDEAYGMDTSVKKEMKQAMKEGVQKTNRMTELGLDPSSSKDYDKFLEMEAIKQKYGNVIDDNLLQQILVDDNPQRKAEVLASIDEAIKMQEKGIPSEEIINIIKNTTRTKQANGGIAGLL